MANNLVVLGDEKAGCVIDVNSINAILKEGDFWTIYRTHGTYKNAIPVKTGVQL
jgi:hypothetical protein